MFQNMTPATTGLCRRLNMKVIEKLLEQRSTSLAGKWPQLGDGSMPLQLQTVEPLETGSPTV